MNKNNISLAENWRQLIRLKKAEVVMLVMTRLWHKGLCTTKALDKADLNYLEALAQV